MMSSAEDERAIVALINRYATGLDGKQWELLRSVWADDVEADYGTGQIWTSGDALNAFMTEFHLPLVTMHMNGNYVIEDVGAGRARGRTYFKAVLLNGDGSLFMRADGWYDDEFKKLGSEWKIARRRARIIDQMLP